MGADHGHRDALAGRGRAFTVGITLNLGYVVAEAAAGIATGSLALLADAGHNLADVVALGIAWVAFRFAGRRPSSRFTYGLRRGTVLASLAGGVLLLATLGAIGWEAVVRLSDPPAVPAIPIIVVAGIGVAVNAVSASLFAAGRHADLNVRAAFLHLAADAAVSAGVVLAGAGMWWTGARWLDPAVSLVVVAVVLYSGWGLFRDALALSLDAVPGGVDLAEVERFLRARPGVTDLHDLHVWAMSTTETALTVHLTMPEGHDDAFLYAVCEDLAERFGIGHATLQIERGESAKCRLT